MGAIGGLDRPVALVTLGVNMAAYSFQREQLLAAIRRDCEVFLAFYLGVELTLDVPDFHK